MVAFCHVMVWGGLHPWPQIANVAVDGFFLLSGYVLALSYDGRFLAFVVRRFIRLWPVYVVCLTAGYALNGMLPALAELIWWPNDRMSHLDLTDKVVWTLYIEAWATPLLPVLVAIARRSRSAGMTVAGLFMLADLGLAHTNTTFYFSLFAIGVAGSRFPLRFPDPPAWMAWFGQQAYSLYLTNWLVLVAFARVWGPAGAVFAVPAIFIVSWAVWRVVEIPSIRLSRRAGAMVAGLSAI
jgi:peptidoglycan/LPS O-acetylase OafA/YrhL